MAPGVGTPFYTSKAQMDAIIESHNRREFVEGARPMTSSGKTADKSNVCPSSVSGLDYLRDPRLFKGMGFTLEERQALGIHGLLPPRMKTMSEQVDNCLRNREYDIVFSRLRFVVKQVFIYVYWHTNQVSCTGIKVFHGSKVLCALF